MPRRQLVKRSDLAAAFEVPPARIGQWVADGMPVARPGRRGHDALYDLAACRAWREARELDVAPSLGLEQARARLAARQQIKLDLALGVATGELVPRDVVLAEGQHIMKAIVSKVRALPRKLSQASVIGRDVEMRVAQVCADVLTEISQWETMGDLRRAARRRVSGG